MNIEQLVLFGVLVGTLILFVVNRWRYDIVALIGLLIVTLLGVVPPQKAFTGFGHPAVIMVAAVLVLSRGLFNAGVVDSIARVLARAGNRPTIQVAMLTTTVALCSGFMNNVGALALLMPVAIWMSRQGGYPPSLLLMPLAFGSLLGGTVTLIGTPPNIIIAAHRRQVDLLPFGMFDFFPVGGAITVIGVLFIALIGWRLSPRRRQARETEELFPIADYLSEVRVPEDCKFVGQTLHEFLAAIRKEAEVAVIGLFRKGRQQQAPSSYEILRADDILLIEADSESLKALLDITGVVLAEDLHNEDIPGVGDLNIAEAVVTAESPLVARTAVSLNLRERFGLNVLAVARQGRRIQKRLGEIRLVAGDILLCQGREGALGEALTEMGCLPLAERGLRIGRPRKVLLAAGIFVLTLALIALGLVPAATALVGGAVLMVLTRLLPPSEVYKSIELPVIVLLAAMIPIGEALETTGGAQLIADVLLDQASASSPPFTVALLMAATMLLSNVINNAAAAILVAPIATSLAHGMGASADPLLMAVAIGASCAFLTPIGHQSNTLVMAPGGYRFSDYWRMGLPLSLLVIAVAVPMILWVWPL